MHPGRWAEDLEDEQLAYLGNQVWMLAINGLVRFCTYCLAEILKHQVQGKQRSHVLFLCYRGLTTVVVMGKVCFVLGRLS